MADKRKKQVCVSCGELVKWSPQGYWYHVYKKYRHPSQPVENYSSRLVEAICVGMVSVTPYKKVAQINAVPKSNQDGMSDNDWLNVLIAGGEMRRELEGLGYAVKG